MVLTYRAYRHLNVLRIALPITVLIPHLYGCGELGGTAFHGFRLLLLAFIFCSRSGHADLSRDAVTGSHSQTFGTNSSQA